MEILREMKPRDTLLDISWKEIHHKIRRQNPPQKGGTNREMESRHIRRNIVPATDSNIWKDNVTISALDAEIQAFVSYCVKQSHL